MQNEILQKIINYLQIAGWLIGLIGTLFIFSGGLIGYIFNQHKKTDEREHGKLFDKTDDHETRISKIEGKNG